MAAYTIVALSNPVEGQEDEYNRWYDEQHLKDVTAIDGVIGARRLGIFGDKGQWRYLALYEAETEDPQSIVDEIRRRSGTEQMPISSALDKTTAFFSVFGDIMP